MAVENTERARLVYFKPPSTRDNYGSDWNGEIDVNKLRKERGAIYGVIGQDDRFGYGIHVRWKEKNLVATLTFVDKRTIGKLLKYYGVGKPEELKGKPVETYLSGPYLVGIEAVS